MKKAMAAALVAGMLAGTAGAGEIVVITNTANQASRMFSEQAAQFFLGKSNQFTPVDQGKESPIRRDFYQKLSGKSLSQVEGIWAKIEFSGKGSMPKAYPNDAAVKKAVAADPTAIGYIDKAAVDDTVKVLLTLN
jgi:ABC-type phosphate transport system substrate-binding protein